MNDAKNAHMTGDELKRIRLALGFAPRHMRATLVPKGAQPMPRRTYEDYEANKRQIPAKLAARISEIDRHNRELQEGMDERIEADLKRHYKGGRIPSFLAGKEEEQ